MKKVLMMIALVAAMSAQFSAGYQEDGFNGLAWGSDMPGNFKEIISRAGGMATRSPCVRIPGPNQNSLAFCIEKLTYHYVDGKLNMVNFSKSAGLDFYKKAQADLQKTLGKASSITDSAGMELYQTYWFGPKTLICLEYDSGDPEENEGPSVDVTLHKAIKGMS